MFVFNTVKLLIWCSTIIIVVTIKHLDDNQDKMHKSHELNINIEFPFLVGLISDGANKNLTICTGTLLSAVFVMSSVYCTMRLQTDRIKVRMANTALYYYKAILILITENETCCNINNNINNLTFAKIKYIV